MTADHETRRLLEMAARAPQPQPPGIDPALAFFAPSFYQFLTADVTRNGLNEPEEDRVDAAYDLAVVALRKLGFDYVPKLRWKEAAVESNGLTHG